ncbi:gliding motility lipoprotein GldH family protein [Pseudochryseolinea flava]|uniref:Gliding motility lipoprotein GldH n=1 Tax=Pseudochryseolinea flava TaxID=2059302 RepID=A0A364Y5V8_9BACT|nr:hypothetical protein [Pseudochryseolinea flava]RAW02343.1 hypothetical protein DQQ10_07365 [Pseudochryseolinea flava]
MKDYLSKLLIMTRIKQMWLGFLMLIMFGCHTYKKYEKNTFADRVWERDEVVMFKPTIDDGSKKYKVSFALRHLYGLRLDGINIQVAITSPKGEEFTKHYRVDIMDGNGEYKSNCAGDLCDLEIVIEEQMKFTQGEYIVTVSHTQYGEIPGIMEVGFVIDAAE